MRSALNRRFDLALRRIEVVSTRVSPESVACSVHRRQSNIWANRDQRSHGNRRSPVARTVRRGGRGDNSGSGAVKKRDRIFLSAFGLLGFLLWAVGSRGLGLGAWGSRLWAVGRGPWAVGFGQCLVASFHPWPMAQGSWRIADSRQPQAWEPTAQNPQLTARAHSKKPTAKKPTAKKPTAPNRQAKNRHPSTSSRLVFRTLPSASADHGERHAPFFISGSGRSARSIAARLVSL